MSASVFKMRAQIHRAEQMFVLQLLEGKAEKILRTMHKKHGIVSITYLVTRTFMVELLSNYTETFEK